jgi:hypothetical protein
MSKLTTAHYEMARAIRWHARQVDKDMKVSGRVERYHRSDRYRNIRIIGDDKAAVDALAERLRASPLMAPDGVEVTIEVGDVYMADTKCMIDIAIWPARS